MSHSIDRVVTASQAVVSRHGSDVYSVDALPRPLSVAGVINIASTGWRRGLDSHGPLDISPKTIASHGPVTLWSHSGHTGDQ